MLSTEKDNLPLSWDRTFNKGKVLVVHLEREESYTSVSYGLEFFLANGLAFFIRGIGISKDKYFSRLSI